MSIDRLRSKAVYFPALEEPKPAKLSERRAKRFSEHWIEIIVTGEGRLGLARLEWPKYLALLTIGMLSALPHFHP